MKKYGSLYPFQMEEVERQNNVNKIVFYCGTNHGKGKYRLTTQVLLVYLSLTIDSYLLDSNKCSLSNVTYQNVDNI